ncbi:MAG: transcriptional repressor [Verrucomicrobiales bacterium]|nr:transcriptional repressor [Verrucomicrobiales bacterium]
MSRSCPPHLHRLVPPPMGELTAALRKHSRKVTGPRQAILEVLRRHQHPLANREIHRALGPENCDLATVYRNLHTLEGMGLVRRYDFGDGTARFELVPEGEEGHHHHLICQQCALIVEVEECFPEELEQALARRHGFTGITHRLEFFGLCPRCAAARPTPAD